jgi:hypothetical protein
MSNPNLKVVKLITGDELIGTIRDGATEVSDDDNYTLDNLVFITNPMKIISDYDAKTKVHALYLSDWIPAISDLTLPIDKQRIVTLGTPNKDLEAHYIDILLAQKLLEDLYPDSDPASTAHKDVNADAIDDSETDLVNKLKKHKFDDDDIQ